MNNKYKTPLFFGGVALIALVGIGLGVYLPSRSNNGDMPVLLPRDELGESICSEIDGNNLDSELQNFRLSGKTLPTAYDLWLYPNMATQESDNFAGYIKMDISVKSNTDKIVIHQSEFVLDKILVDGLPIQHCATYLTNEFLIIYGDFVANSFVALEIYFSGPLIGRGVGFFKTYYKIPDGDLPRQQLIGSKHEPTYARKSFPCFDEPAMKVPLTVHLIHPKDEGFFALSNMPSVGSPRS